MAACVCARGVGGTVVVVCLAMEAQVVAATANVSVEVDTAVAATCGFECGHGPWALNI